MKLHRMSPLTYAAFAIASVFAAGAANALSEAISGSAYGFIDRNGEVVVAPACSNVFVSQSGDWVSLERDGKQGFANLRTRQFTGLIFEQAPSSPFGRSLFAAGPEPVFENGRYGYVDQAGRTIIPFRYEQARQFTENKLALVKIDSKFGYINPRGDLAIPARFEHASEFEANGLATVNLEGFWGAIDQRGELVIPAKFDTIWAPPQGGLFIVGTGGRRGAVDAHGRIIVPIKFGNLRGFAKNGLAAASPDADPSRLASEGGHWGFINRKGEFVVPPVYIRVSDFEEERHREAISYFSFRAPLGLAETVSSDASGLESTTYIDAHGKPVLTLPPGITGQRVNRNGVIDVFDGRKHDPAFSLGHRFGIFDPAKPAIPTVWFDLVGDFGASDLVPIRLSSGWGYADRNSNVVIPTQFQSASAFTPDGLATVRARNPTLGRTTGTFIDRTGNVQLQTPFDEVGSFDASGFAMIIVTTTPAAPIALPASQCAPARPPQ
jgi:uncharacterized protein YraI